MLDISAKVDRLEAGVPPSAATAEHVHQLCMPSPSLQSNRSQIHTRTRTPHGQKQSSSWQKSLRMWIHLSHA